MLSGYWTFSSMDCSGGRSRTGPLRPTPPFWRLCAGRCCVPAQPATTARLRPVRLRTGVLLGGHAVSSSSSPRRCRRSARPHSPRPHRQGTRQGPRSPRAAPCARSARRLPRGASSRQAEALPRRAKRASTSSQCSASTTPGAIAFTLIPWRIRSSPALCVRLITAAFDAQYTPTSASPRRPACEAKLMIRPPPPCATICRAAAWSMNSRPSTFTAKTRA